VTASARLRAAVDLGAGSGRVFVGALGAPTPAWREVHRFTYAPGRRHGHLRWDVAALFAGLRDGAARAADAARRAGGVLDSIGVDGWGVDYGLVDEAGGLVEDPICYRDERTEGVPEKVLARVAGARLFDTTGIQQLRLNTLFQLYAHVEEGLPPRAARLLMIPDLCHHFLCGSTSGEPTNASTTQLLNARNRDWDDALFRDLGLPRHLMPPLAPPGAVLGWLRSDLGAGADLSATRVIQPATHDTASAVAGTPLTAGWAFISSGTWSLVGVERLAPILGPEACAANFTNEIGVSGTVRFLKNVMGLWILDGCVREWSARGRPVTLAELLAGAATVPASTAMVFPDAARFFNPSHMATELRQALAETGQPAPDDPVVLTRIVIDSLALRYASVIADIERLTGQPVPGIHIVGGGSLNDVLNQATADASGKPVLAGPVEAAAAGNLCVQALASGEVASIGEARRLLAETHPPRRFEPRTPPVWRAARERYAGIESAQR
jgi:rhamnulokinase